MYDDLVPTKTGYGIQRRAVSHWVAKLLFYIMSLNIILLKLLPYPLGSNELSLQNLVGNRLCLYDVILCHMVYVELILCDNNVAVNALARWCIGVHLGLLIRMPHLMWCKIRWDLMQSFWEMASSQQYICRLNITIKIRYRPGFEFTQDILYPTLVAGLMWTVYCTRRKHQYLLWS